jgi:hypothetical protein
LVEGRFLRAFDATTCQRLFGLKLTQAVPRSPIISSGGGSLLLEEGAPAASTTSNSPSGAGAPFAVTTSRDVRLPMSVSGISFAPLTPQQRVIMLLEAAFVPYLGRRVEAIHSEWTDNTPEGRERRAEYERSAPGWQLAFVRLIVAAYPVVRAVLGIAKAAVWLAYLSNRSPYPSVTGFLTGTVLARRTPGDEALQRLSAGSNQLMMLLSGVITWTIVGFEVADWWVRDGGRSSVLRDRRALPPPPPFASSQQQQQQSSSTTPPAVAVQDGSCPICKSHVANPSVNIASGYVYCYPCLSRHIREHGTDPVKPQLKSTARHIRRLFIQE